MINLSKVGGTSISVVKKNQLVFKFINWILFSRSGKITIASGADLILLKCLSSFELINPHALMIEHINKVILEKEEKHGILYGTCWERSLINLKQLG